MPLIVKSGALGLVFNKQGHGTGDTDKGYINYKGHSCVPSGQYQGDKGGYDDDRHLVSPSARVTS